MGCKIRTDFLGFRFNFRAFLWVGTDVKVWELKCHVGCKGKENGIRGIRVGWDGVFEGETSDSVGEWEGRREYEMGLVKHEWWV